MVNATSQQSNRGYPRPLLHRQIQAHCPPWLPSLRNHNSYTTMIQSLGHGMHAGRRCILTCVLEVIILLVCNDYSLISSSLWLHKQLDWVILHLARATTITERYSGDSWRASGKA